MDFCVYPIQKNLSNEKQKEYFFMQKQKKIQIINHFLRIHSFVVLAVFRDRLPKSK